MYTLEQQKANRKLWVEALRSGKYKQGNTYLRSASGTYCCLGVLAELAGCEWSEHPNGGRFASEGHSTTAPPLAKLYVGLTDGFGAYRGDKDLARLNDDGTPFAAIADLIESNPPGLFRESA